MVVSAFTNAVLTFCLTTFMKIAFSTLKLMFNVIFLADLDACTFEENQTPIHYAAKNDAAAALKILINIGADVNCRDYKQRTPLYVAAELGGCT